MSGLDPLSAYFNEFKYAIRSDICAAEICGQASFLAVICSSICGPCPHNADTIVICPSNPVTSIGPILAVPGIVAALGETRAVVGVSPIVGGAPVSGPAGRLMQARRLDVSPLGVAEADAPWLDALLIDTRDGALGAALQRAGVRAVTTDVMMTSPAREIELARAVLAAG